MILFIVAVLQDIRAKKCFTPIMFVKFLHFTLLNLLSTPCWPVFASLPILYSLFMQDAYLFISLTT